MRGHVRATLQLSMATLLRPRRPWLAAAILCAAAVAIAVLSERAGGAGKAHDSGSPPRAGLLAGPPPWPANTAGLRPRLASLGLPALPREGTVLHIHQHLDLYVDGRGVTVPAGIGIDVGDGFISPLHTHDESGVIHVESPTLRTFTLAQLFGVWGVRLTPRCLGGDCTVGGRRVWIFLDGRQVHDAGRVVLREHQEILVAYGTRAQLPVPIPAGYRFPYGL